MKSRNRKGTREIDGHLFFSYNNHPVTKRIARITATKAKRSYKVDYARIIKVRGGYNVYVSS